MIELDDVDSALEEAVDTFVSGTTSRDGLLLVLQSVQDAAVAEAMAEKNEELAGYRAKCDELSGQLASQGKRMALLYASHERITSLLAQTENAMDSVWSHRNPLVRGLARMVRWPAPSGDARIDFDIAMSGLAERARQDEKWGADRHQPNGTGLLGSKTIADDAKRNTDRAFANGVGTWRHILEEEVYEAFAERNPKYLKEELTQVMAVCMAWIRDLNSQGPKVRTAKEIRRRKRRVDRMRNSR